MSDFAACLCAAAAKFTGSGGAVVAFCPNGQQQEKDLQAACKAKGFTVVRAKIGPQLHKVDAQDWFLYVQKSVT